MPCEIKGLINHLVDCVNQEKILLTDTFNKNDTIALYFGAQWCAPCTEFENALIELRESLKKRSISLCIILISSDNDYSEFLSHIKKLNCMAVSFENQKEKKKLSNKFQVSNLPLLALVDGATGTVLNRDARRNILGDPTGNNFPWQQREIENILADGELTRGDSIVSMDHLQDKQICLYFSAEWCPPCRKVTPILIEVQNKCMKTATADGKTCPPHLEVVYISYDRDEATGQVEEENVENQPAMASANPHAAHPSWIRLGGGPKDPRVAELAHFYGVTRIPHLVVLGPVGTEGRPVLCRSAVQRLLMDPSGFPWLPGRVSRLTVGTMEALVAGGAALLFITCAEEDLLPASKLLESVSKELDLDTSCYVGVDDDSSVRQIRSLLNLGDQSPLLLHLDFDAERVACCPGGAWSGGDLMIPSREDLVHFLAAVEEGHAEDRQFPAKAKRK